MQLISGAWISQAISVAASLGLADLMTEGPRTADELAAKVGAHAPSLYRLLRSLASVGVFSEAIDRRFGLTPLQIRRAIRSSESGLKPWRS